MSRRVLDLVVILVCLLVTAGASAPHAQNLSSQSDPIRRVRAPIAGQYIVALRDGGDPETVGRESARLHRGRLRHAYRRALHGFSIDLPEAAARALARDPRVEYVQEDGVTTVDALSVETGVQAWGLDRIDQRARVLDGRYRHSTSGIGVNVYIVDTGIRTSHVSFQGRAFGAYNAIGDGIAPDGDCYGHGTHVAGTVGGDDVGVASGVLLYSVKALGCDGRGTWSAYIAAIDWVVANHRKPAVINASIGGGFNSASVDAIHRAVAAGITFVGAAGNDTADACTAIPGGAPDALAVAASTAGDERAYFSNRGTCVALFAPGDSITSTSNASDTGYAIMSGTSMASPHVAGAAALYLEQHPAATPAQVRKAIVGGATPGIITDAGAGSPNLLLFSASLGDAVLPTLTITSPAAGAVVRGTVTLRASAADDVELAAVRFSTGGVALASDSAAPFEATWDTTRFANAPQTINVDAQDRAGNVTHRSLTATVANGAEPQAWATGPVGTAAGQASYTSTGLVLQGAGADIWGPEDDFYFAHHRLTGDGDLVARISSLVRPSGAQFAMAGLMFRESLDAGARQASLLISTEGKLKFRRRTASGGATVSDGPGAGTTFAPKWLKLSRRGNVFSAYLSSDGTVWSAVHVASTVAMPATVEVGLVVLRSGGSGLGRATFENVGLGRAPAGWGIADVGAVGSPGLTVASGDTFTLDAAGSDLWSTQDAFHFAYRKWSGDGDFVALVDRATAPADSSFAMAGITVRGSLAADSPHASLVLSTDGKAKFRRRSAAGGITASDGPKAGSITIPQWVRLTRVGNNITAYVSPDGTQWQRVHTTQSVVMPSTVYIGVLGLRNGGAGTASIRFSKVAIR